MTDQQFQDLVFRLETSLSSLAIKQDDTTSTLSQQLTNIARAIESNTGDSSATRQASIFVSTLNRDFNFNALKPREAPDQIGATNQVFISGMSPSVRSMLRGSPTDASGADDPIRSAIGSIPLLGSLFEGIRSVASFFTDPANLLGIGGIAVAFNAFSDWMNSDEGSFFKLKKDEMIDKFAGTIGKIIGFFTGTELTSDEVQDKVKGMWDKALGGISSFWLKYIWNPTVEYIKKQWETNISPQIQSLSKSIISSAGLPTARADWILLFQESISAGIDNSIMGKLLGLYSAGKPGAPGTEGQPATQIGRPPLTEPIDSAQEPVVNVTVDVPPEPKPVVKETLDQARTSEDEMTNFNNAQQDRLDSFITAITNQTSALCECITSNRPIVHSPQVFPGPAGPAGIPNPAAPGTTG
jgi:hypothetical protein